MAEADDAESADIGEEFGLGRVLAAEPLADGHPDVMKLTTERGAFVVKPAYGYAELSEQAAHVLNRAGIRQAVPVRTTAGQVASASGRTVLEFLPGEPCLAPSPTQTIAAMRHIATFHAALRDVPAPAALDVADTLWAQVVSPRYLVAELPGLLQRSRLAADGRAEIARAVQYLDESRPLLDALPRQLVHGDIGPDNVLMDGDDVVAIIDFTPYHEPFLFAVATAVYWYHVHGHATLDADAIRTSLVAAAEIRPWTDAETAAWPAMLVRESLRRLATYLALGQDATRRYAAALSVARLLTREAGFLSIQVETHHSGPTIRQFI